MLIHSREKERYQCRLRFPDALVSFTSSFLVVTPLLPVRPAVNLLKGVVCLVCRCGGCSGLCSFSWSCPLLLCCSAWRFTAAPSDVLPNQATIAGIMLTMKTCWSSVLSVYHFFFSSSNARKFALPGPLPFSCLPARANDSHWTNE